MSASLDELDTPGDKAAVFREGNGGHALIALRSAFHPSRTGTTTLFRGNRKCKEGEEMQMNVVQNPFPDLFPSECLLPTWTKTSTTQAFRKSDGRFPADPYVEESRMNFQARRVTLPAITPLCLPKRVIKVYNEDNSSRAVEVPSDISARDICQLFILKNHCIDDNSWTLIEHLPHLGIERIIEDHESVLEVQSNWGMDSDSRLYFRKNYAKYEFFKKPLDFFPESMVSVSSEANGLMNHSELIQTFLSSSTCPEIHGFLYSKEQGRKSWKKFYFVLRRSGLYFSNKGTSKEPRHLQFVAEFCDGDVYTLLSARKSHGAPTDFAFCVKVCVCVGLFRTHPA